MANKERDLRELKKYMDDLFVLLRKAKTENEKLRTMEVIQATAEEMAKVVEKAEA